MQRVHRGLRPTMMVAVAAVLLLLGSVLIAQSERPDAGNSDSSQSAIDLEFQSHNKNDGKDNCPNDGNAGKGNDNKGPGGGCKSHPPNSGGYGNPNKNDGKDNCPNDGNAGKGNDNKGPGGGCKSQP